MIERRRHVTTPRSAWRMTLLGMLVGVLAVIIAPIASAAPVKDLNNLPPELQKYVPNSPAWSSSPWMASPTCKDRGGEFSIWVNSVINDTPALLAHFNAKFFGTEVNPEDKPRWDAVIEGYRKIAQEIPTILPAGYCADDMRRWAGSDGTTPFGFPWGITKGNGHQTRWSCTERPDNTTREAEINRYFGAERGPCDAFYVSCADAQMQEKTRCEAWNSFSDDYVRRVTAMRDKANNDFPYKGTLEGETNTEVKSPGEVIGDVVGGWFEDLTRTIAEGSATLMAESMTWWTRTDRSTMLQSPAITEIQSLLKYVGIALLTGSVIWQGFVMVYKRKLDPLVSTGMGLLSFVGWSTLGGSIAVLLNEAGIALSTQVLDESINKFSKTIGDSLVGQVAVATGAIFLLSIVLFFLACIQWVLGFFRMGALVILLALLPTAAAGQANESTKPWLKKVLSWCLSLILYQPIAAIIFAIGLQLMGSG